MENPPTFNTVQYKTTYFELKQYLKAKAIT